MAGLSPRHSHFNQTLSKYTNWLVDFPMNNPPVAMELTFWAVSKCHLRIFLPRDSWTSISWRSQMSTRAASLPSSPTPGHAILNLIKLGIIPVLFGGEHIWNQQRICSQSMFWFLGPDFWSFHEISVNGGYPHGYQAAGTSYTKGWRGYPLVKHTKNYGNLWKNTMLNG